MARSWATAYGTSCIRPCDTRSHPDKKAHAVTWLEGDITTTALPSQAFDVSLDRAVFHFLTDAAARNAWRQNLLRALWPGGFVILATFADDGPEKCSGLPVQRHSESSLQAALGGAFTMLESLREIHVTPGGNSQRFVYGLFQRQRQEVRTRE
ncbi:MAG TPA: class I SAM-dependent methyltransferase [Moraxellaceae bacterium]|nr:class I SAM-dependent methyltransferase [Moraxellaceae bacterium]